MVDRDVLEGLGLEALDALVPVVAENRRPVPEKRRLVPENRMPVPENRRPVPADRYSTRSASSVRFDSLTATWLPGE